jgi:uroporphyrin-III C-methyltransferase/precorrin-2 dehydrogenase/sirohydrochlorin ferrochelatase
MAALRVRQLLAAGARVKVVATIAGAPLLDLAENGSIELHLRSFLPHDISADCFMVVGATDDPATQAVLAHESERRGLLYNVVDDVEHCNFFTPAVVERGDLKVAISTNGRSPVLARRMREELEAALPEFMDRWVEELGELRQRLKFEIPSEFDTRKRIIEEVIEKTLRREPDENGKGKVFIVGAGPGAADLITLRGLRALRRADVVLYDALVNPDLLSEAPAGSQKVFVGKRCGRRAAEQRVINRRMVEEAGAGRVVVRLKGGDPLVYGRGGEEALACEEAGIAFEIVPGVTSALGAASHAGIPLTHRGIAASVAVVTARVGDPSDGHDRRLAELARSVDTLVIYMGGSHLSSIAASLTAEGVPETTPVAVISNATLQNQQTVLGTLAGIAESVAAAGLSAPMLVIVGAVANLSPSLNWFERRAENQVPPKPVTADER